MRMRYLLPLLLLVTVVLAGCVTPPAAENEKTIYVGPELVDCTGETAQQCMQVKESPDAEWTLYYDQIEGFTYEPGYDYQLVVREEAVENPPAGASATRWVLVNEVSKTPVVAAGTEEGGASGEEVPAPGAENQMVFLVGPELVDCVGVAPQQCMLVKRPEDADFGLFYDPIEGFTFEPGFEYELLVQVDKVDNPPADGSSLKYTLVQELSRTPVETSAEPLTLEGPLWVLTDLLGTPDAMTPASTETIVTAQFAEGRVAGNAGCNSYNGPATIDGNNLTIGELASTLMMCSSEAVGAQETTYLSLLQSVATYAIEGDVLTLSLADGNPVLIYQAVEPTPLEGTLWIMTSYNNGQEAVVSALEGSQVTAQFANGEVNGSAGCNTYFGQYTLDGANLTIGPLASTRMFCETPEGTMDQEAAFMTAMQNAATYQIQMDALEIFDANGARQATFIAAPPAEEAPSLAGSSWTAVNIATAAGVSTLAAGTEITAQFGDDGMLSGTAGCNNYSFAYTVDGQSITISPAGISTQMFCGEPAGVMEQEAAYMAALPMAATFSTDGGQLTLFDAAGAILAVFDPVTGASLTGVNWSAVNIRTTDSVTTLVPDSTITAVFGEDGTLSGNAGCNNYGFSYTVDGQNITINPAGISTGMFCETPEGVMDQEAAYLAALPTAATFSIANGQLTLLDAEGGIVAVYDPVTGASLTGVNWTAVNIRTTDSVTTLVPDSTITAVFGEDGTLSGNAGCNNYGFSYTVDGQNITINPAGISTGMFCETPEGVMDQEAAYLAALPTAATFSIANGQLTLLDAEGGIVAVYDQAAAPSLTGVNWTAVNVLVADGLTTLVPDTEITALFSEEGFVSGTAGCNNYNFSFTVDGQNITMNPAGISTQMFCEAPEGVMDQEAAYLAALPMAATFSIEGGQLILFDAAGAMLVIYDQVENLPLTGTNWLLSSFHTTEAISSLLADTEITLMFGEDGQVTGSAGCNGYFGGYTVDGENLTIGPLGATMMACGEPEGVMAQETDYLAMLDSVATYSITGDTLTLLDANGQTLLTFVAAQ